VFTVFPSCVVVVPPGVPVTAGLPGAALLCANAGMDKSGNPAANANINGLRVFMTFPSVHNNELSLGSAFGSRLFKVPSFRRLALWQQAYRRCLSRRVNDRRTLIGLKLYSNSRQSFRIIFPPCRSRVFAPDKPHDAAENFISESNP
jgi:hypothetical protein